MANQFFDRLIESLRARRTLQERQGVRATQEAQFQQEQALREKEQAATQAYRQNSLTLQQEQEASAQKQRQLQNSVALLQLMSGGKFAPATEGEPGAVQVGSQFVRPTSLEEQAQRQEKLSFAVGAQRANRFAETMANGDPKKLQELKNSPEYVNLLFNSKVMDPKTSLDEVTGEMFKKVFLDKGDYEGGLGYLLKLKQAGSYGVAYQRLTDSRRASTLAGAITNRIREKGIDKPGYQEYAATGQEILTEQGFTGPDADRLLQSALTDLVGRAPVDKGTVDYRKEFQNLLFKPFLENLKNNPGLPTVLSPSGGQGEFKPNE